MMRPALIFIGLFFFTQPNLAQDQKHFDTLRDVFAHISADLHHLFSSEPDDENLWLQLAADSQMTQEYTGVETEFGKHLWIVTANLYDYRTGVNRARGASQNGNFYVLQLRDRGFRLIGVIPGNRYRVTKSTHVAEDLPGGRRTIAKFISHWRGAPCCPVYIWDGESLVQEGFEPW